MFLLDTDTIIFSLKGNTAVQKNRGTQTHQLDVIPLLESDLKNLETLKLLSTKTW